SAASANDLPRLLELDEKLREFYRTATEQDYWEAAENSNGDWRDGAHPQHAQLLELIDPNARVADFGCGSAHAAAQLGNPRRYTGIDWGERQLERNRQRFPDASFHHSSLYRTPLPDGEFDIAMSLFVLEHTVFPTRLLDEMMRVVKPGGRVIILCPQMRPHVMNSMWAGTSAMQSFWEKIRKRRFFDAAWHAIELRLLFPIFCRLSDRLGGRFLIYPKPRCFYAPYSSDTDAVYWADEREVRDDLAAKGCTLQSPPNAGVVFVIAQKP
ncbi:MAG TPA: class I SAM-dependent methyltransferase, partial [Thermoanaerobaculia bacterium]|nr:class I SAM-dependent methyltransferase [Thermoanaerobaculia bacterium]